MITAIFFYTLWINIVCLTTGLPIISSSSKPSRKYLPTPFTSYRRDASTRPVYEVNDEMFVPGTNDGDGTGQSAGHTFVQQQRHWPEGKVLLHHNSAADAVASAITTLDCFLGNKSYNTPLHPPPSPVLALILSHYGRYLPSTRIPRVYSYMTVNNIHNNRPFGQYKWSSTD